MAVSVEQRRADLRAAMVALVAERGFHGATMRAVADRAGTALGTAYVHHRSKDDLVVAAYLEVKRALGVAAAAGVDAGQPAPQRFAAMWHGLHRHLRAQPEHARFLVQVEASPLADRAHEAAMAEPDDPLMREAARPDIAEVVLALPFTVLFDLAFGPAIRAVAREVVLDAASAEVLAEACWQAVTGGGHTSP